MVRDLTQIRTVGNWNVGGVDLGFGGHQVDNGYVVPAPAAAYIKADLLARGQKASDVEVARQYFINSAHFDQVSAPKGKK